MYFCEDHFDLPNDMINYMEYHMKGTVSQVRMKPVPPPNNFFALSDDVTTSWPKDTLSVLFQFLMPIAVVLLPSVELYHVGGRGISRWRSLYLDSSSSNSSLNPLPELGSASSSDSLELLTVRGPRSTAIIRGDLRTGCMNYTDYTRGVANWSLFRGERGLMCGTARD
ncbi:unnamed protein product [Arctia plantaginis]|uniref:Uncharacterized protein n=1 Tax=Arctia plantaginis TaxID=874455 RepID=A0A8S1AC04_ARCPL|nr:unnamed protein product [Arctia plantaginis]